jgi:hypothetical protein
MFKELIPILHNSRKQKKRSIPQFIYEAGVILLEIPKGI